MRLLVLIFCLTLGLPAAAQDLPLPDYRSITVNDYADLLDDNAEATIAAQLTTLRKDTGIEMTVLTLESQEPYWKNMELEPFATALFNHWGIGDKTRNDGILVMVLRDDRAMRIELGKGYGTEWNRAAAAIIDRSFLPDFRDGNYQAGIMAGVTDTIDNLALPFSREEAAPFPAAQPGPEDTAGTEGTAGSDQEQSDAGWFAGVIGLALVFFMRQNLADWAFRFRRCPQCGQRTLRRTRRTLVKSTTMTRGKGEMHVNCSNCGYHDESTYTLPRLSKSSSSKSFGGGSSSGGGASGRW